MTIVTSHFQLHCLCYTLSPLSSSSPHCISEVMQGLSDSQLFGFHWNITSFPMVCDTVRFHKEHRNSNECSWTCSRLQNKLQLNAKVSSNRFHSGTKRTCRRHVLIDKNMDENGDRLTFSIISLINTLSVSSVMRFNKTAAVAFV